jgi:transcriptional regulator with XRE-family HTH domain
VNKFADRLRHARLLRGLSQAKLAKACGLSQGAIANYEGKNRHSAKEIFKLADALKVSPVWLSQGSGPMEPDATPLGSLSNNQLTESGPSRHMAPWPFRHISPDEFWALPDEHRSLVDTTVTALISALPKKLPKP